MHWSSELRFLYGCLVIAVPECLCVLKRVMLSAELCLRLGQKSIKDKGDLPEKTLQLLQSMYIPVPGRPEPPLSLMVGGWPCAQALFDAVPDIEDNTPNGPEPSMKQLKKWASSRISPGIEVDPIKSQFVGEEL